MSETESKTDKDMTSTIIIIIVLGLVLVAIWLWLSSKQKKDKDNDNGNGDGFDDPILPPPGNGDPITGVFRDDFHQKAVKSSWITWHFAPRFVMSLHAEMRPGGGWELWPSTLLKIQYWDLGDSRWRTLWDGEGTGQKWTVIDLGPQVETNNIRFKAEADWSHLVDWIDEVKATMMYSKV